MSLTQVTSDMIAFDGGSFGFRNRIINGAMNVWQRATTYALTAGFAYGSADRWSFTQVTSANGVANQVASALSGFRYDLKLGRNSSAVTTGNIYAVQAVETANSVDLAGQTVTLSLYAKAGSNFSASASLLNFQIYSGTGADQTAATLGSWTGLATVASGAATLTTSYQRFTVTGTVPANATQLAVQLFFTPTGTAGADDFIYITGVQLEKGAVATAFDFKPIGVDISLCHRYFQLEGSGIAGNTEGTTSISVIEKFSTPMRAAPSTVTINSGNTCQFRYSGADQPFASPTLASVTATSTSVWALVGGGSALTSNLPVHSRNASATNLFIALNAEI